MGLLFGWIGIRYKYVSFTFGVSGSLVTGYISGIDLGRHHMQTKTTIFGRLFSDATTLKDQKEPLAAGHVINISMRLRGLCTSALSTSLYCSCFICS